MYVTTRKIIYPEGDELEIEHSLTINELVDLNGFPLELPLPTSKMIVYRVRRKSTDTYRGGETIKYYLDLVTKYELEEYVV